MFQATDEGPIAGSGGWYFGAVMLLLVATFVAVAVWKTDTNNAHEIAVAIVAVAALPFAFLVFRVVRVLQKLGRAVLTIPYDSLALGHVTNATYSRPLRGGAALQQVEARLQCEEHVTRGSGKNKRTFIEVVHDEELKTVSVPAMNELRMQIPIRIPEAGPPTIYVGSAETKWVVRMRLRMENCPDTRSSFDLTVLPAVVKR